MTIPRPEGLAKDVTEPPHRQWKGLGWAKVCIGSASRSYTGARPASLRDAAGAHTGSMKQTCRSLGGLFARLSCLR
jgi:hypothetical protein